MHPWEKAIKLELFIRNYTPENCREPIHVFAFSPSISPGNYSAFEKAYKEGNLKEFIETYSEPDFEQIIGHKYYRFNEPFVIEAIQAYFDQQGAQKK